MHHGRWQAESPNKSNIFSSRTLSFLFISSFHLFISLSFIFLSSSSFRVNVYFLSFLSHLMIIQSARLWFFKTHYYLRRIIIKIYRLGATDKTPCLTVTSTLPLSPLHFPVSSRVSRSANLSLLLLLLPIESAFGGILWVSLLIEFSAKETEDFFFFCVAGKKI